MKSFGYPIPLANLYEFLCPDNSQTPYECGDFSYISTDWWTLRTKQGIAAPKGENAPEAEFAAAEAVKDGWKSFDFISSILNKYPARIWERTHQKHHLATGHLCYVGNYHVTKGILQLCSRLPNAELCPTYRGANLPIRFTKGMILLRNLPPHVKNNYPPLMFFQPV